MVKLYREFRFEEGGVGWDGGVGVGGGVWVLQGIRDSTVWYDRRDANISYLFGTVYYRVST